MSTTVNRADKDKAVKPTRETFNWSNPEMESASFIAACQKLDFTFPAQPLVQIVENSQTTNFVRNISTKESANGIETPKAALPTEETAELLDDLDLKAIEVWARHEIPLQTYLAARILRRGPLA